MTAIEWMKEACRRGLAAVSKSGCTNEVYHDSPYFLYQFLAEGSRLLEAQRIPVMLFSDDKRDFGIQDKNAMVL